METSPSVEAVIELQSKIDDIFAGSSEQDLNTHTRFLRMMLGVDGSLPSPFVKLDASHPWLVFWPLNSLELVGSPASPEEKARAAETILQLQNPDGGFAGGVGQSSHVIGTYAAIMALSYGSPEHWARINVAKMYEWLMSLKQPNGSFITCEHGEADPRTSYCALAVATILNIVTPALTENVGEYIQSCQTYEGGYANTPLGEAHGGYAFCSLATLMMLKRDYPRYGLEKYCNISKLSRWLLRRQDPAAGAFNGRTNKLVDSCYSHWIGGCWPLVSQVLDVVDNGQLWNRQGLRDYLVKCCQFKVGGFIDKPGARPDAYHSNYSLCGLALAQHIYTLTGSVFDWTSQRVDVGPEKEVVPINPIFGIPTAQAVCMGTYFTPQTPSREEYQGFALYVSATVALLLFLAWSLVPQEWLHSINVVHFPSRYWAVAVPAFILVLMLYIYIGLDAYNKEVLTPSPTSLHTFTDIDTMVHDEPLSEVNKKMYS